MINNIIFLGYVDKDKYTSNSKRKHGNFRCFCGKEFINRMDVILSSNTKSCGCLKYSFRKIEYNQGDPVGDSGVTYIKDVSPSVSKAGNRNRRGKFKCKCGNKFEAGFNSIRSNDIRGCGCLHGSYDWIQQANNIDGSTPTLYIIKCFNESEEFIKVGITFKAVKKRFKSCLPYKYEILYTIYGFAEFIWNLEQSYHKQFNNYSYLPKYSFDGMRECYTMEILNDIEFQKCD